MNAYQAELYHHGIKGQRWGVRRYQNPDGSLTAAGQKRYSKLYKSEMNKLEKDLANSNTHRFVKAHNMTADDWDYNGKNKDFNLKPGEKKLSSERIEQYEKLFGADRQKNFNKILLHDIENNVHYLKAKSLCEKYKMQDFDTLVQKYSREIDDLRKSIG